MLRMDAQHPHRIGGLGHLAIQYGLEMGYIVASRGEHKKGYALKLGVRRGWTGSLHSKI